MNRKYISNAVVLLLGLLSILVILVHIEAQVPRNAQIAFVSDRDGNGEIYIMNADGNLTRHLGDDREIESLEEEHEKADSHLGSPSCFSHHLWSVPIQLWT